MRTMWHSLDTFLREHYAACSRARQLSARFRLPALTLIMRSAAYQTGNIPAVVMLARDLKAENLRTIELARTHPDVFHRNVIRSRQAENEVYDAVIRLARGPALEEAA